MVDYKKKEDDGASEPDERLVAVRLLKPLGDNGEGDVIHVPESLAEALVEEGCGEMAKAEDMGGEQDDVMDEAQPDEQPVVQNAVNRLTRKVEKAVAGSVAKAMALKLSGSETPGVPMLPATNKEAPFRSVGAMVYGIYKALYGKSESERTQAQNRVMDYQNSAAKVWSDKLGYQVKSPLGINEGTNSQGGFLVNPEFSPDVYAIEHGQLNLQEQCVVRDAKSNVFNQRFINESSLANGSIFGGLNMVATAEGVSFTSSLPAWANISFTLQKLAIFSYYTSELLEDSSYPVEQELSEYIERAFVYGINSQIVQGSTLEGLLNSPGLVSVTHSSNDTAFHTTPSTALTYADLAGIWSAVYPDSKVSPKGMWLIHPALEQCLVQMTYTFSGSNPAWGIQYNAEDGLAGKGPMTPYRIFGKPAYPSWACSAPGLAGDILYVDFNTVLLYRKPFRVEVSKEVQFLTDQIAVRAVNRLDCKTRWRNTITGPTGTSTFSAVVTRTGSGT